MATPTASPKATGWVLGTVFVSLLLAVAAWFFLISPVLDRADAAREQASTIQASNQLLEVKIQRLEDQFANIEEYRAELAALRTQIPTEAQLDAYLQEVDALAVANGVTVTAITTSLGQTVVVPETVQAAPPPDPVEPAEGDAATDTETEVPGDGTPTAEPTPPASVVPEGFVAIPLGFAVLGPYENVVSFLGQLQTGTQRLFLVVGLQGDAQEEGDASGGRPATVVGDIELYVGGLAYVLTEPAATAELVNDEVEAPVTLPGVVPGKNPLIPVGGSTEP